MSIRPVDLQIMIPGTTEVAKMNNNEQIRPELNQHQFAESIQKEVKRNEERVLNSNKTEQNMVEKDGRGASGWGHSKKRRENRREDTKDEQNQSANVMFDVSI